MSKTGNGLVLIGTLLLLAGSQSCSNAAEHPAGWIQDDFAMAQEQALETGKPILLDLYADWCGPCRTLGEQYFTAPEMQQLLSAFVLARADVDAAEGARLAETYGGTSIPCVLVLAADGSEYGRIVGLTPTIEDYISQLEAILSDI